MHVVVVGGGIWGLSTAWALIREGHGVTLIDKGPLPNPVNASFDQHRLTRLVYAEAAGYAALIREAHDRWADLWTDLGRTHYVETGTLATSTEPGDWTDRALENLKGLGIAHTVWTPGELAAALPILAPEKPIRYALYQPQGGVLLADRIAADLVAWLGANGVVLRPNAPVVALDEDAPGAFLASGERIGGDALVLCCGAWSGELVPEMSGRAQPYRQAVVYLEPPEDLAAMWRKAPIMVEMGGPDDLWGAPPVAGTGMKVGVGSTREGRAPWTDLDPTPEDTRRRLEPWRGTLPDLDRYRVVETRICYYAKGADDRFVALRVAPRSWALGNDAGHGYKFGPWIGCETARMLTGAQDTGRYRNRLAGILD